MVGGGYDEPTGLFAIEEAGESVAMGPEGFSASMAVGRLPIGRQLGTSTSSSSVGLVPNPILTGGADALSREKHAQSINLR